MFCYIHIPFCENKCKYCKFASFWVFETEKINKYVNYLCDEITLPLSSQKNTSPLTPLLRGEGKKNLKSIYFWWWTPSTLNIEQISKIILTLKQKYTFDKNIEITLESTPNKITKDNLLWWQKLWINRLSIWVQTLNNKSLKEIWRGEKWNIIETLDLIKNKSPHPNPPSSGMTRGLLPNGEGSKINVNLDFIIWLPYVKLWEVKNDIELILDKYKFINHISVYMLEEHYYPDKWKNLWIKEEDYLCEYIDIKKFLKTKWFNSYEISNFAKKWYECKHNKAYWNHSEILAFWLWAHWYLNWYRYENYEDFEWYYNKWIKVKEKLYKNDIFLENIMFGLRTKWLKKEIYNKLNKIKIYNFIKNWYLKIEDELLKIEDKWILVMDYILGEIL
jgi:oxygen-independent coproporphyrinogen-3 oxidase